MRILTLIQAAAIGLTFAGTASAGEVSPIESQAIDLGDFAGDAYYTVRPDGYHVVATLAARNGGGAPVRIEAVLAPGQGVTLSTPRAAGIQPVGVAINRAADHLTVTMLPVVD